MSCDDVIKKLLNDISLNEQVTIGDLPFLEQYLRMAYAAGVDECFDEFKYRCPIHMYKDGEYVDKFKNERQAAQHLNVSQEAVFAAIKYNYRCRGYNLKRA